MKQKLRYIFFRAITYLEEFGEWMDREEKRKQEVGGWTKLDTVEVIISTVSSVIASLLTVAIIHFCFR